MFQSSQNIQVSIKKRLIVNLMGENLQATAFHKQSLDWRIREEPDQSFIQVKIQSISHWKQSSISICISFLRRNNKIRTFWVMSLKRSRFTQRTLLILLFQVWRWQRLNIYVMNKNQGRFVVNPDSLSLINFMLVWHTVWKFEKCLIFSNREQNLLE